MKVLITGSKGYIGANLKHFLKNRNVQFIECDLPNCDIRQFEKYKFENINAIIHSAAISGLKNCIINALEAYETNVLASYKLIDFCLEKRIPFIFTSSQAAKGTSYYGYTKACVEDYIIDKCKFGLKSYIFRLTNVYGGIDFLKKKNTVISKFLKQYKNNEKLTIYGDGNQKRNFIHVLDVCEIIYLALNSKVPCCTKIDIGSDDTISINDLAKLFSTDVNYTTGLVGNKNVSLNLEEMNKFYKCKYKLKDWLKDEINN
ncbi:SDR family oxidoreductase [bacterium]|nr:SDR family oxidoreductase [bacterium]